MAAYPSDHTRARFDETLRQLEADAVRMGSLVLDMVRMAAAVLLDERGDDVAKVMDREVEVDAMEGDLVHRVIVAMVRESPIARDLLFLSATLFLVSELEKIGDEATKLASRAQKLDGQFPYEMAGLLREMSGQTQSNLQEALRLYTQYSPESAARVVARDDLVDTSYKLSRNALLALMRDDPDKSRQLLRSLEVFHALEHVSDRSSDIAKRMRACYEPFSAGQSSPVSGSG